jgi:hypothetical protein
MLYSAESMHRLDRACAAHDARSLLFAVDARDRVHAAAFLVHDTDVTYLLTSGVDTELRSSGAQSFLVWEAIRHAATRSRSFDFAGSMIESVERFNRGFGARQYPYLSVRRTRGAVKPLLVTRNTARHVGAAGRRSYISRRTAMSDGEGRGDGGHHLRQSGASTRRRRPERSRRGARGRRSARPRSSGSL